MAFDVRFVFLERPAKLPMQESRFKAKYSQTLEQLQRELDSLNARQITIQAGFRQVRNDGWPYASSRAEHPACALQFQSKGETMVFRSHKFNYFEDNLRAITLTLESLRAVNRYGVVEGEQYAGFKQVAAPEAKVAGMTREIALMILRDYTGLPDTVILADIANSYRIAARKAHPDQGGSDRAFRDVAEAKRVLEA